MIFRKKSVVSFACVVTSAALVSGSVMAAGAGPMERDLARASSDSVSESSSPSTPFKHHNRNRKIDSLNSVTVKSGSESKSYRFDHTGTGIDIHGGLSLANMTGSATSQSSSTLDNNLGVTVGAGYDCELSSNFAARPEINFIQKGFSTTPMDGVNASLNMYYIEVPLLLKASTDMGGMRPNLVAGPAFAVNVGNSAEAHTSNASASVHVSSNDIGAKTFDYGMQFGGGVEVATNNKNAITADFRYDLGLANINKDSDGEVKNRAFIFTMGFKF